MTTASVFKLLTEAEWSAAQAAGVTAAPIDLADGFVHLSSAAQVRETARRYFSGQKRVCLLRFAAASLAGLRWEVSRGGERFPHLYGALNIADANGQWWLTSGPDGAPDIPEAAL